MCDDITEQDNEQYLNANRTMSRRQLGKLGAGAVVTAMLPPVANAMAVTESGVTVTTPDGNADCYFVHPATGKHPAVLVWPDIFGLRPAFQKMGKRLAESGYTVLVVNPYYRRGDASIVPAGASFSDPDTSKLLFGLAGSLSATTNTTDARAFIDWLDAQQPVDTTRKIGTTGYCMGGPIVMRTAAAVPDRIGAGASFHGGGLVTDQPDSPHLLVPKMKAHFLFAMAENDDEKDPTAKEILREVYAKAGLPAEIEVYEGAMHGWCPPDSRVYNERQAERAWKRLLALLDGAL
ncbi:MAG: dienelactone hydrolase [Planctomycetaceae bacterium]|nr:dienelactone hydrolase [Planctomycetaceae bacterium]